MRCLVSCYAYIMTTDKDPARRLGELLWVLNAQYFIVQAIVAASWSKVGYSWAGNTISDLGNTHCGPYGTRLVCSPMHAVMNISFITLGMTIIGGAALLQKSLASGFVARLGFWCMAAAGAGAILVGSFPENSVSSLHITGAALSFLLGNLGMILLGVNFSWLPKILRSYTVLSGLVGLVALVLFLTHAYAGIDIGGMERVAAYPQTIWMIIFGVYLFLQPIIS